MNCEDFQDRLHEYLDETLGAVVQAAAREHVGQCGECRCALERELALAQSIRQSLDRATAGLSPRPNARQNILRALESEPAGESAWPRTWKRLVSISWRPLAACATLLAVFVVVWAIQLRRRPPAVSAPETAARSDADMRVIDLPIQTQAHVFHWEKNTVVDMVVPGQMVGYAQLPENRETPSHRL